ncbi:hypothetical protein IWW50_004043, partial [Coemansia erecta]
MEAEASFCRVCRGEGTTTEPLFFPCRCSGSIKYVHQSCLEEWLAHSNKKYCELCGYEYAFSPLYDPNMPATIPRAIVLRQMVVNVAAVVGVMVRLVLVVVVWLFVLPYLVYWLTRFYFWSGQSVSFGVHERSNATQALVHGGAGARRFEGFDTWHDWYVHARDNGTVAPISSYTGLLDGSTNAALLLYSVVRIALKVGVEALRTGLGVRVSDEQFNSLVEMVAEFNAKSLEGSAVTVLALLAFMGVFMLRDWIVTNAPVDDDIFDEAEGEEEAVEPAAQEQANQGPPHLLQLEGRPIEAENPQHRPLFENPPHEGPALEDLPPDERPVRPLPASEAEAARRPDNEHNDDNDSIHVHAQASGDEQGANALAAADESSFARLMDTLPAELRPAGYAADEHAGRHERNPSGQRTGWAYADEAFDEEPSDGNDEALIESDIDDGGVEEALIESDIDGAQPLHGSDLDDESADGESADGEDLDDESADEESAAEESVDEESVDGDDLVDESAGEEGTDDHSDISKTEQAPPAASEQASPAESSDAWSFVNRGDGLRSAVGSSQNTDHVVEAQMPPTFTGESSRAIYAHARQPSGGSMGGGSTGSGSTDSSDEGMLEEARLRAAEEAAMRFREERAAAERLEAVEQQLQAAEQQQQQLGNLGLNEDEGDQGGDFVGAEDIWEAVGLRGPLANPLQYFVLVLIVVGMVLAFFAWLPYICGRAFVALNPVRMALYGAHVLFAAIDAAAELVLDELPALAWRHVQPVLAGCVDVAGPAVVYPLGAAVPGLREALGAVDGRMWAKLAAPEVQRLVVARLQQSRAIRILFPLSHAGAAQGAGAGWVPAWVRELAPGGSARELRGAAGLLDWELRMWQRLAGVGIPIDRVVGRLEAAAGGASLDDRMAMVA